MHRNLSCELRLPFGFWVSITVPACAPTSVCAALCPLQQRAAVRRLASLRRGSRRCSGVAQHSAQRSWVVLHARRSVCLLHSRHHIMLQSSHLAFRVGAVPMSAAQGARPACPSLAPMSCPEVLLFQQTPVGGAAPEQMMGEQCTLAADMYSFGILLIELTTQQPVEKRGEWRLPRAPRDCPQVGPSPWRLCMPCHAMPACQERPACARPPAPWQGPTWRIHCAPTPALTVLPACPPACSVC